MKCKVKRISETRFSRAWIPILDHSRKCKVLLTFYVSNKVQYIMSYHKIYSQN